MALSGSYEMRGMRYKKGFTLVELLIALSVSSLILTAVATLAFAMSSANKTTDDTSQKQAQVRFATLRITDLIRHCKLVCSVIDGDLIVWRDDSTPGEEGLINVGELVYIETSNNSIQLLDFPSSPTWLTTLRIRLSWIQGGWIKATLKSYCDERYVAIVPECSNVQFQFDESPPQSRFVSISFDVTENGSVHQYQIDSALRSWAGNLLNETGDSLISDDD